MENPNLIPVTVESLNYGNFISQMQDELDAAISGLVAHVVKHEMSIRKAAASVAVSVTISYDGGKFGVEVDCKHKVPGKPKTSMGLTPMPDADTGALELFAPKPGAFAGMGKQKVLAQADGTGVDLETQERSEAHTIKVGAAVKAANG